MNWRITRELLLILPTLFNYVPIIFCCILIGELTIIKFKITKSTVDKIRDKLSTMFVTDLEVTDEDEEFVSYGELFTPHHPILRH
jgi:hypothetical protein